MFKLFVFVALLAFAAAAPKPGVVTAYTAPVPAPAIVSAYSAPVVAAPATYTAKYTAGIPLAYSSGYSAYGVHPVAYSHYGAQYFV